MTCDEPAKSGVDIMVEGRCGVITLNRPEALNALTLEMCHEIAAALQDWRDDPRVKAIIIRGAGRAFCAGGDIRSLYDSGLAGEDYPYRFYHDEYRLNALIHHYPKPYIALLNGIVMGGGVGVSVHGSRRLATENIRFAMPETGIGLFPDVGGAYFLSRCPGETGLFLALTGTRIGAADALCTITLGAAYTLKLANEIGSIECGKRADFAVLEDDPTKTSDADLKDLGIWGVALGGRNFPAAEI